MSHVETEQNQVAVGSQLLLGRFWCHLEINVSAKNHRWPMLVLERDTAYGFECAPRRCAYANEPSIVVCDKTLVLPSFSKIKLCLLHVCEPLLLSRCGSLSMAHQEDRNVIYTWSCGALINMGKKEVVRPEIL